MSTRLHLKCDGCFTETHSERFKKEFVSVSGRSHGYGSWHTPKMDDVVPEGWIWSDPYTACTYCPKCWEEIQRGETAA